ncbi:T9SS type A sorting domain-containing protein [Telluribacter sp. SYSU D00476]|uniref:T9SS type A sorting domain-containing protein n=1 Tax=Telluribacter sp. SYSU D00476 TaxID=2811430 RepID=UPI001FF5417E|nr:T9SS type A sorting domain-containing protein [Telluribacter sp. SYSU D00476]
MKVVFDILLLGAITLLVGLLVPFEGKAQDLCEYGAQRGGFTVFPEVGCAPLTVTVGDTTKGSDPKLQTWAFNYQGGFNPASTKSTTYTYTKPGYYTILLMGSANGGGFTACKGVKVLDTTPPNVQVSVLAGGMVKVTLISDSIARQYDQIEVWWNDGMRKSYIGPGHSSEAQHIYSGTGQRSIFVRGIYFGRACGGSREAIHSFIINTCEMDVSFTANGTKELCEGQSVELLANTGDGYTYQWFRNGTLIDNATARTYTASVTGSYAVQVKDSNGCTKRSDEQYIQLNSSLNVSIIPPTFNAICQGKTVELKALASSSISRYEWYRNGQQIPNAGAANLIVTEGGTYVVKATNSVGCSKISDEIVIAPPYKISLLAEGSTTICEGEGVKLSAQSNSTSLSSYQWYRNGTAVPGANINYYQAESNGSYTVETMDALGCKAISESKQVVVKPLPGKPSITASGDMKLISSAAASNQWFLDGTVITGATSAEFTPVQSGLYTVQVTQDGCASAMSEAYSFIITSNDPAVSTFIVLYPNPTNDQILVSIHNTSGPIEIELVNPSGKVVGQKQVVATTQQSIVVPFQLEGMPSGVYVVKIKNKLFNGIRKVILN